MTSYSHTITLGEGEYLMMFDALRLMVDHCDQKISENAGAPFLAHKHSAGAVLERLMGTNPVQMSGNNFGDPSTDPTITIHDSSDEDK